MSTLIRLVQTRYYKRCYFYLKQIFPCCYSTMCCVREGSTFGVEFPSGVFYFSGKNPALSKRTKLQIPEELLHAGISIYSLSAFKPRKSRKDIVNNLLQHSCLHKDLTLLPSCQIYNSFEFNSDDDENFWKSFTICAGNGNDVRSSLVNIAKKYGQDTLIALEVSNSGDLTMKRFGVDKEETAEEIALQPVVGADYHPCYRSEETNSVFHDFKRSKEILSCVDIAEAKETLDAVSHLVSDPFDAAGRERKYPFIVVEGLDATGKSTLTAGLQEMLNALVMRTPPDIIRTLRGTFDNLPQMIRRSYYSLGNYIIANEIAEACQTQPVVMDRFWHSTATYALATDCGLGDASSLPPAGHPVYNWPSDLIKPSAIIFLTVSEEIRNKRMQQRNLDKTDEERALSNAKSLFRQRLLEAYKRMTNPAAIIIDASQSVEEVAEATRSKLIDLGLIKAN